MSAPARDLPQEYQEFVERAAGKFFHLRPLESFLYWNSAIESKIRVVTFKEGQKPVETKLEQHSTAPQEDLATWLKRDSERHLYLVEDLSPHTARLLGGYLNINPQFFADYIDMVIEGPSNPNTMNRKQRGKRNIEPRPWYRMGEIAYHLPSLRSVEDRKAHVFTQFIGPREYHPPADRQYKHATLGDRPKAETKDTNVERVAGGHDPVRLNDRDVWPVAMTRHSAAAWFAESQSGTPGDWLKGVILLDRPFESTHKFLVRKNSIYRPFTHLPSSMHDKMPQDSDLRDTYLTSLLHCFGANEQLRQDMPPPIVILQDVYRIVASEWIAVNAYLERDLNAIEWQLEANDKTADLDLLEDTLKKLFIMRRRNRKYKALVDEQLQLRFPTQWRGSGTAAAVTDSVRAAMEADFKQVQDLISANDGRISQTTDLITSVMSVIEGKKSNTQNQRLTFLTILAGISLPFNSLAAILGLQTDYAPGKPHWHYFLALSSGVAGIIFTMYLFVVFWDRIRRNFKSQ